MKRRRNIRQTLVERFVEKMNRTHSTHPELPYDNPHKVRVKRFFSMVESRKQQILDKMLMD